MSYHAYHVAPGGEILKGFAFIPLALGALLMLGSASYEEPTHTHVRPQYVVPEVVTDFTGWNQIDDTAVDSTGQFNHGVVVVQEGDTVWGALQRVVAETKPRLGPESVQDEVIGRIYELSEFVDPNNVPAGFRIATQIQGFTATHPADCRNYITGFAIPDCNPV
jgi:hypothetical protein